MALSSFERPKYRVSNDFRTLFLFSLSIDTGQIYLLPFISVTKCFTWKFRLNTVLWSLFFFYDISCYNVWIQVEKEWNLKNNLFWKIKFALDEVKCNSFIISIVFVANKSMFDQMNFIKLNNVLFQTYIIKSLFLFIRCFFSR